MRWPIPVWRWLTFGSASKHWPQWGVGEPPSSLKRGRRALARLLVGLLLCVARSSRPHERADGDCANDGPP